MNLIGHYLRDFFGLFYPRLCYACNVALISNEECICSFCSHQLPETQLHQERENKFTQIFWGRVDIETATALFYFQKGGKVQKLMHQLKYKGKTDVGNYLGRMLGHRIRQNPLWDPVEMIVPVPMHPRKQHQRGYNQSEVIARGISQVTGKPLITHQLIKTEKTQTQTRKARFNRWKNVETVFRVKDENVFRSKNVLLVDDVITTGSTLEACAQQLKAIKGTRVWMATLAMTI
ncbi:MAG: ComF family protein [Bacteroidales bacterium]